MAKVTPRNILVGAARMWISASRAQGTTSLVLPTWATDSTSLNDDFEASGDWTEVGATQEGVEVAYEPDYGEVEVDQTKGPVVIFNQGYDVSLNTNMAEATLENLLVVWGFDDSALKTSSDNKQFSLGTPPDKPTERSVALVGNAPRVGEAVTDAERERVYLARRVIAIEGSTHALRRTEATVFPVSLRLLADSNYAGAEFGLIEDRVPGTTGDSWA